jgi:hypothetical protein
VKGYQRYQLAAGEPTRKKIEALFFSIIVLIDNNDNKFVIEM